MLLDYMTVRYGVYPGYETLYKDVYTMPEYGKIVITTTGFVLSNYKAISDLLQPDTDFENQLKLVIDEYKSNATYLRKYHHIVIPLSGGFDGRLILSFFIILAVIL
ncbi:hypothetical protein [Nonlabens sp.]|uniref:hypothetical protein n=1 Tax=Nonlabens sp. TaxID=1888209 RepID=UPI003F6A0092